MFGPAVRRHRCILPADGFYEWLDRGAGRSKQPFHITAPAEEPGGVNLLRVPGSEVVLVADGHPRTCDLLADRNREAHRGAWARPRLYRQPAAHQQRSFAHACDPGGTRRQLRGHPLAVIGHRKGHAFRVGLQRHGHRTSARVSEGVCEALLGDSVDHQLDVGRERRQLALEITPHLRAVLGADPGTVSQLSHHEQGYDDEPTGDQADPAGRELARVYEELAMLNQIYEARHGFRYVIFVAGRPKGEIVPLLATGWELSPDGTFERLHPKDGEEYVDSQAILLEEGF
jgi:hypothetical protein